MQLRRTLIILLLSFTKIYYAIATPLNTYNPTNNTITAYLNCRLIVDTAQLDVDDKNLLADRIRFFESKHYQPYILDVDLLPLNIRNPERGLLVFRVKREKKMAFTMGAGPYRFGRPRLFGGHWEIHFKELAQSESNPRRFFFESLNPRSSFSYYIEERYSGLHHGPSGKRALDRILKALPQCL